MNTVIYSPYLDWWILKLLTEKAREYDPLATFNLVPTSALQEKLAMMNEATYAGFPKDSGPFKSDSVIGDDTSEELFKEFRKRNNFSLPILLPPPSTSLQIFLTCAAFMKLITMWPAEYRAQKDIYSIKPQDSFTNEEIPIRGFLLNKLPIGIYKEMEVSAKINLGGGFEVELFDITAFQNGEELLRGKKVNFNSLLSLIPYSYSYHYKDGYLHCPCVEENYGVENHLAGIQLKNTATENRKVEQITIDSSKTKGLLKLSEEGVRARVETVATARMVLTASYDPSYVPVLNITKGLVVKILYQKKELMIAYVPQEKFKRVTQ